MGFSAYMKIGDFDGGCKAKDHEGWVELTSFKHAMSLPGSLSRSLEGGISAGDPDHKPLSLTYLLCPASPKIYEALNKGSHIDKVEINTVKQGGDAVVFMKYTLENVVVTSVDIDANGGGDSGYPSETIGLSYAKITWEHKTMDEKGAAKGTVATNYSLQKTASA